MSDVNMARRGNAKANFLSLMITPENNEMAIIGLKLWGKVATFMVAAKKINTTDII